MKLWIGYGSEHSANLVIVGHFKSADEAAGSMRLLRKLTDAATADERDGHLKAGGISQDITDRFLQILKDENFSVGYGDPEQLLYEFNPKQVGDKVVITTEENDINAVIKALLHGGAKVEVFSAHDHESEFGR